MTLRLSTADPGFEAGFSELLEQARETTQRVDAAVTEIIAAVRARGDAALVEYTARFDRWQPADAAALRVTEGEIEAAVRGVSPELRASIVAALARDDLPAGFECARRTRYLGRWIRHGGWYPDRKLRLFRRSLGRWGGTNPHDHVRVEGRVERLSGDLLHYSYRSLSDHLRTIDSFTTVAARGKHAAGRRARSGAGDACCSLNTAATSELRWVSLSGTLAAAKVSPMRFTCMRAGMDFSKVWNSAALSGPNKASIWASRSRRAAASMDSRATGSPR